MISKYWLLENILTMEVEIDLHYWCMACCNQGLEEMGRCNRIFRSLCLTTESKGVDYTKLDRECVISV